MRRFSSHENYLEAEVAKRRPSEMGIVSLNLPPRPIYTNDIGIETRRLAEHSILVAQLAADAEAWNAEARRWRAERVNAVAEQVRADAASMHSRSGINLAGTGDLSTEVAREERATRITDATDFMSGDMGLAGTSFLMELAEREEDINEAVYEARALADWMLNIEERRQAAAALCAERRRAFIERWQRKVKAPANRWSREAELLLMPPKLDDLASVQEVNATIFRARSDSAATRLTSRAVAAAEEAGEDGSGGTTSIRAVVSDEGSRSYTKAPRVISLHGIDGTRESTWPRTTCAA